MKNLLIVESPAKSKTIQKYLGADFEVLPSVGHVRDLEPVNDAIDIEGGFKMKWKILPGKQKNINAILAACKKAENIYLSPDPDREGEAIAWHLYDILDAKKAFVGKNVKRVVFHEITKTAVQEALKNPRDIDNNLVDAYLARRVLDFEVGFKISPVLWKKLPGSKSAGRVQSVALRVLCEREEEIEKFVPVEYYSIDAVFKTVDGKDFSAKLAQYAGDKLDKFSVKTDAQAKKIVADLSEKKFAVSSIEKKQSKRRPYAPFTTSTLQQDASRKLGMSAKQIMSTAQRLYESGLITYMRTDSVALSKDAIEAAREFIGKNYSSEYLPKSPIFYANKSKNAQEAHEAIRPTSMGKTPKTLSGDLEKDQWRLYDLIWKRTVASQMENAVLNQVAVDLVSNDGADIFRANGSMLAFDGFLVLYNESKDEKEEDDKMLPTMAEKDAVATESIVDGQHFTQAPPRYTEASLVKKLEEMGIGRPSTYAAIIDVIQVRNYVRLEKKRFICEDRGMIVIAFLKDYFSKYVEYDFTAFMEDSLDEISAGEREWKKVILEFYGPFMDAVNAAHKISLEDVCEKLTVDLASHLFALKEGESLDDARKCPKCGAGKLGLKLGKFGAFIACSNYPTCDYKTQLVVNVEDENGAVSKVAATQEDALELGEIDGLKLTMRKGPYGHYVQLGETVKGGEKPKRSSLPKGMSPESVDLEKAKFLLSLPLEVAKDEDGTPLSIGIGPYGPYIKKGSAFVSIPAGTDLFNISPEFAIELAGKARVSAKKASGKNLGLDGKNEVVYFDTGRYGPYVKSGKKSVSVDKKLQNRIAGGEKMTLAMAVELLSLKK